MPRARTLASDGSQLVSRTGEARFVDPETGVATIVQPVGTKLKPGNKYFNAADHGNHIFCVDCTAPLRFRDREQSSGGSSGVGSVSHFVAKRPHDPDCLIPKRAATAEPPIPVDRSKGYILLVETAEFSYSFNKRSGFYEVSEFGRRVRSDDSLKDREVLTVRSAKDIMDFIRRGEKERIFDTIVVFQNNPIPWRQFCILNAKPERIADLVERAKARTGMEEPPFALVEIKTNKPLYHGKRRTAGGRWVVPRAPVSPVEIGRKPSGVPVFARFDVYPDAQDNTNVSHAFYEAGTYFILGEVRHREAKSGDRHYLSITITHPDQIAPVNIENLSAEAKAAREKRLPKPLPPVVP